MEKLNYVQDAERPLSNSKFSQLLTRDPTAKYQKELQNLMKNFSENTFQENQSNTKTSTSYLLSAAQDTQTGQPW